MNRWDCMIMMNLKEQHVLYLSRLPIKIYFRIHTFAWFIKVVLCLVALSELLLHSCRQRRQGFDNGGHGTDDEDCKRNRIEFARSGHAGAWKILPGVLSFWCQQNTSAIAIWTPFQYAFVLVLDFGNRYA